MGGERLQLDFSEKFNAKSLVGGVRALPHVMTGMIEWGGISLTIAFLHVRLTFILFRPAVCSSDTHHEVLPPALSSPLLPPRSPAFLLSLTCLFAASRSYKDPVVKKIFEEYHIISQDGRVCLKVCLISLRFLLSMPLKA